MSLTLNQKKSQILFLQIILKSAHLEKVMETAQITYVLRMLLEIIRFLV
jgi:hypothetical protein